MLRVVFDLGRVLLTLNEIERLTTFGVDPKSDKRVQELEERLKRATPGYPSGRVWRDWQTRKTITAKGNTIDITNSNPVAFYLEYGTAPHKIVPRNAKMLHISTPEWEGPRFLERVNHPGTRPTLFATKTWIKWASENSDLGSFVRVKVGNTYTG